MANNRTTRELETRVVQERPKQWMPAELLPEPDKQPEHVAQELLSDNATQQNSGSVQSGGAEHPDAVV